MSWLPEISEGQFSTFLREAIDDTLSMLGIQAKAIIYNHLESKCQFRLGHIDDTMIGELDKGLRGLFGSGADKIETLIAKRLYEKLGLNFTNDANQTLIECVNYAKKPLRHELQGKTVEALNPCLCSSSSIFEGEYDWPLKYLT